MPYENYLPGEVPGCGSLAFVRRSLAALGVTAAYLIVENAMGKALYPSSWNQVICLGTSGAIGDPFGGIGPQALCGNAPDRRS